MTTSAAPPDSHDSPLSEADIQAYADGTLSPERTAFLRDYLDREPAEARRVAFYGRLNAQIQQAFQTTDEAADPAIPMPPPRADRASGARRRTPDGRERGRGNIAPRPARLARTLIALILLLVTASGWFAATQLSAQSLNNAAVMALAEASARPYPATSPTLTDASAPDLASIGLRLVDQRVLAPSAFQRAQEYIYLNRDGLPVVVLSSLALLARPQPQWMAHRIGGIRLLTWTARRQRFVVAGEARTHSLMLAADALTMH